jgi:hypothetical protein
VSDCVHIDLDGAWPADATAPESYFDCRAWGRRLRYSATARNMDEFYEFSRGRSTPFTLFGSGDYHHLTALWIRRIEEPFTLVSFDNHPDWDIRPPLWGCGTWINRALEVPTVRDVAIWGCGNFELDWPGHLFVSRRALRARRLNVWPWTERLGASGRRRWPGMSRENWRAQFEEFAHGLAGKNVYVTVDLDCLDESESVTNWEHGLFKASDIEWALGRIAAMAEVVGGDLCGAYSKPGYARLSQRLAAGFDRPRRDPVHDGEAAVRNDRALRIIWSALTRCHQRNARADQHQAQP